MDIYVCVLFRYEDANGRHSNSEGNLTLWRTSEYQLTQVFDVPLSRDQFTYPPLIAEFRHRETGFEFIIVSVYTRPSKAKHQIPLLPCFAADILS